MTDYLQFTIDKFTFQVATDRFYSKEGVWAKMEDGRIRTGLSDFLQQVNGDVAFAELPAVGSSLSFDDELATIETIKVDISIAPPASGQVIETNLEMELEPDVTNSDPYRAGWLAIIEPDDWPADQAKLLNPQDFFEQMKREAENEVNQS